MHHQFFVFFFFFGFWYHPNWVVMWMVFFPIFVEFHFGRGCQMVLLLCYTNHTLHDAWCSYNNMRKWDFSRLISFQNIRAHMVTTNVYIVMYIRETEPTSLYILIDPGPFYFIYKHRITELSAKCSVLICQYTPNEFHSEFLVFFVLFQRNSKNNSIILNGDRNRSFGATKLWFIHNRR